MQHCGNETLQRFLENLITELKRNDDIVKTDDIPFVVSSLYQRFRDKSGCIIDLLGDLKKYSDYNIIIESPSNNYDGICDIKIYLYRNEIDFVYDEQDYHYVIEISIDERMWGYCQCEPGDKDYREDKQCCGHGCDWSAPSFTIYKVLELETHSWRGDEHDFWDFEDKFYESESELKEQKINIEKELEIKQIEERMKADEQRLKELMEGK